MAGRACRRHGPVSAQRRPLVGPLTLALLLLLLQLALVSGQAVIDYSELPKCAYSCTLLAQAQGACVPPQAQTTNQQTYESCFCQSAYLRTLYSSANGVCDAFCGPDDLLKIQDWYTGRCQSVSAPTPGSGPPPSLRKSPSW